MKKYFVYFLLCADGTLYCGFTDDPDARLKTHNAGKGAKYTRSRLPVKLVYREEFDSKSDALKRECALKRITRAEKLAVIGSCSINRV
jgi:putative endonuclease